MKTKNLKILLLASLLPFLSGCSFLDNIVSNIALNVALQSDFIVNKIALVGDGANVTQLSPKPTTEANKADLAYGVEALVIPDSLSMSQMGFNITIDFAVEFSSPEDANLFYIEALDLGSEMSGDLNASAKVYYPTGSQDKPESIEALGDWLSIERLKDLKNEVAKDISIKITGTAVSSKKSKSQTYFFNLNSNKITIPGSDVDINEDYAIAIQNVDTPTTLDVTLDKDELVSGVTVPLQIFWIDFNLTESVGTVSITINTLLNDYDVIHPDDVSLELIVNETLLEYPIMIKLKGDATPPAEDLVIQFSATLTLNPTE